MDKLSFASSRYWDDRYKHGKTSGKGSYGKFAEYKAGVINSFIQEKNVKSVLDFGCGDGNQARFLKCDKYIGYDVSQTAIKLCKDIFKDDSSKEFTYFDMLLQPMELAMSCEVIFHLIEDEIFNNYMNKLFNLAKKYIIIYSSNYTTTKKCPKHVKHRKFTDYIVQNFPEWGLIQKINNKYPEESFSDFYIYGKNNSDIDNNS